MVSIGYQATASLLCFLHSLACSYYHNPFMLCILQNALSINTEKYTAIVTINKKSELLSYVILYTIAWISYTYIFSSWWIGWMEWKASKVYEVELASEGWRCVEKTRKLRLSVFDSVGRKPCECFHHPWCK